MAAPSHRHQSSLEGVFDFSTNEPLFTSDQQRAQVVGRFRRIVDYFEAAELQQPQASSSKPGDGYNRPALIRLTFEYARSQESQDRLLSAFFKALDLEMFGDSVGLSDDTVVADFRSALFGFADYLVTHFFLPLQASTNKTPQLSPIYPAADQPREGQHTQEIVETPERLSVLRGSCLVRDRHRCVITQAFDRKVLKQRLRHPPAKDDDGNPLDGRNQYGGLEVAHILPNTLTKEGDGELRKHESRKAAIAIMDMLDVGVIHLIEGNDINQPRNALILSLEMHQAFGQFEVFFEPIADEPPHSYRIDSFYPFSDRLPVTRTLFMHPSIDPPSERLLALHSAIGHILHLSGAGDYIEVLLRDMEDGFVREDGSTELGVLVNLALQIKG